MSANLSEDAFLIQQAISLYHQASSVRDWDAAVSTFTEDGTWELMRSGRKLIGQAAIRQAFVQFTEPLEYVIQLNAPALMIIDGNTATAKSSIRESGKFLNRDEGLEAFGIYHDRLVRTEAGWKFAYRAFETRWLHKVPINPA